MSDGDRETKTTIIHTDGGGGGSGAIIAVVLLIAVIALLIYLFGGSLFGSHTKTIDVNVKAPSTQTSL
jgi:uncharacterized membrane protein